MDETYVGGKRHHVGGGYKKNKTLVIGAVERGGEVRLRVIKRGDRRTLHGFVNQATQPTARTIYTDENPTYEGIGDRDTTHETVKHSAGEYVRADVHTNTVEGVWSLLKRSIVGSYHQVSTKHLPAYLDEIAFKYNQRRNPFLFRDTVLKLLAAEKMPFRVLVVGESR